MTTLKFYPEVLFILCFFLAATCIAIYFHTKEKKPKKPAKHFTLKRPVIHMKSKRCLYCNKFLHEHQHVDSLGTRNYYCSIKPK
jgi:thioredoxin-related protein